MKKWLWLFPVLMLLCGGCTAWVEVDGERYAALNDSHKSRLVAICRKALQNNLAKGIITRSEYDFCRKNDPVIKVRYRGDYFGSAWVIWRTPERLLEFLFEEDLIAEKPLCAFSIGHIPESERRIQPDKSIPGR